MEIPALSYFLFWASIGVVFSRLGFHALDKTEFLSSVSPLVISFFKHSLALSACCSSAYAFLFSPRLKAIINIFLMFYLIAVYIIVYYTRGPSTYWYFSIFTSCNFVFCSFFLIIIDPSVAASSRTRPQFKTGLIAQLAVGSSVVLVCDKTKFFPCASLTIALFIFASFLAVSENESIGKLLHLAARGKEIFSILTKKKGKLIEFAVGLVGTILFQNFFRLTSFNHVVAFLYFAVAWLANLALVRASDDFGIFNFLLSNVIVGCTVSQFGLRGTTWLVYGVSLLFFRLRLKLDSLSFVHNDIDVEVEFVVW